MLRFAAASDDGPRREIFRLEIDSWDGLEFGLTAQTTSGARIRFIRDPNGNLIAMHTSAGTSYYTLDAQGSVLALTDSIGTTDAAFYTYDPYGNTLTSSGTLAGTIRYTYVGASPVNQTDLGGRNILEGKDPGCPSAAVSSATALLGGVSRFLSI